MTNFADYISVSIIVTSKFVSIIVTSKFGTKYAALKINRDIVPKNGGSSPCLTGSSESGKRSAMESTVSDGASTVLLMQREDCKRTKHDSAFSQWKILIGPRDWDDYLLSKEGAERYRTHNLPNCSSCPGLYELGIAVPLPHTESQNSSKPIPKKIIPVYLGQADNVRTRLQQYGRDGAHLENGWSNREQIDRKVLGLFSDIFSYGFGIAFRWAPMDSKKEAEKKESQLLKTFDYAWNRGMNGERRPVDIHQKLTVPRRKRCEEHKGMRVGEPNSRSGSDFVIGTYWDMQKSYQGRRGIMVNWKNGADSMTCAAVTRNGSFCRRKPGQNSKFCWQHH
ncbi:hypothetical protein L2E82_02898 [Cichorium intybus]|uniref:Uncharacterized protein n=1 Tax=Cichorium intybus TaxID=13427 RepID=A0ACB9H4J6_CICIN|nr:hypothetical protein L2E82_02898 [Cichorium intybus]